LETDEVFGSGKRNEHLSYLDYKIRCKCFGASEAASQQRPYLVQFVLSRFYQNMGEVVHEWYEARRSFHVTPFV